MNRLRHMALVMLPVFAATGCSSDVVTDPSPRASATPSYAAEWVGVYEGTATATLLDAAEEYSGLPVCLELWVDNRVLRAAVYVQAPLPDVLMDASDVVDAEDQAGMCTPTGAIMTAQKPIEDVTSKDALRLKRPIGTHVQAAEDLWLQIEHQGDDLIGFLSEPLFRLSITVARAG